MAKGNFFKQLSQTVSSHIQDSIIAIKSDDFSSALILAKKAVKKSKGHPEALHLVGKIYSEVGENAIGVFLF